jgi:hypothetical protein
MTKQTKGNVAPGLIGRTVQFMECPNEALSKKLGTVEGSYVEDGRLMLVLLMDGGTVEVTDARYVTVLA